MIKKLSEDLNKQMGEFKTLISKKLPERTAMLMEDKYNQSFEREENAFKKTGKWVSTKAKDAAQSRETDRGGILVKSGRLKDSAEAAIAFDISTRSPEIILQAGYDVGNWNLAEIHNEGLKPQKQRQFMPMPGEESPELTKEIEEYLDAQMDKIFK